MAASNGSVRDDNASAARRRARRCKPGFRRVIALAWQDGGMSQGFGMESPTGHTHTLHRKPARYLVVIDAAGTMVAKLFLDSRELVAEFDAGSEEVAVMAKGLRPHKGADSAEWDVALEAHNPSERAAADVYTLDL
jgi:hypothetical protein